MFSIGTFSRLSGTSSRALRLYDGLGLFRPAWTNPQNGYRFYSAAQLPELRRIVALRDAGVPLREIHDARDAEGLRGALVRRRTELEAERREVERRLAALNIRMGDEGTASTDHDVVVRTVGREPIATFLLRHTNGDVAAAFYELESHVRDLGRRAARPPGALIPRPGDENVPGTEIYVPLKRPISPTESIACRWLPATRVATLLHRGPYGTLRSARRALESWVAAAGMTQDGPLRILYLQFGAEAELRVPEGWVVGSEAEFLTELQLPVAA